VQDSWDSLPSHSILFRFAIVNPLPRAQRNYYSTVPTLNLIELFVITAIQPLQPFCKRNCHLHLRARDRSSDHVPRPRTDMATCWVTWCARGPMLASDHGMKTIVVQVLVSTRS
jgi:hypothetical protein